MPGLPPEGMLQRQPQAIRRELENTVSPFAGRGAPADRAAPGRGTERRRATDRVRSAYQLDWQLDDADAQHPPGGAPAPLTPAGGLTKAAADRSEPADQHAHQHPERLAAGQPGELAEFRALAQHALSWRPVPRP